MIYRGSIRLKMKDFHFGIPLASTFESIEEIKEGAVLDKTKAILSETSDYAKRIITARFIVGNASDAVTESHILKTIKARRIYHRGKLATSLLPLYFIHFVRYARAEIMF